ncbi:acyltransferase family protein [Paraburkholderia caribensis]|uniref:acyltransferase family protein n=1 Tax=Paraburkholderia caribensis TaxID=75105 RepID=UPI001D08CBBF|nr:acyltransferase [Paraburkholderia caribensis]
MRHKSEIAPLTGLRAAAAIYVFLFHMSRWPYFPDGFVSNVIGQGAVGMSIFFVLSGFVLTYQYEGQVFDARQYFVNRLARIYPVYVLCAILTSVWIGIPLYGATHAEMLHNVVKIGVIVTSNVFLIQGWFPSFFNYWNDGGSWSISVEAFLYLTLPVLLPWLVRLGKRTLLIVIAIAYVAAILPGIVYVLWNDMPFPVYYAMPIFRLPEFVIGACACIAFKRRWIPGPAARMTMWVTLVIATIFYLGKMGSRLPGYTVHDWIIIPTVAMTIVTFSSSEGLFARIAGAAPFVWLGEISYCIYSLQAFIIMPLIRHREQIVSHIPALGNNAVLLLAATAILITASGVCHHLVEEPARRWLKRRFASTASATRTMVGS